LVVGADLDEVAARGDAGLLEVAGHRLVDLAGVDRAESELNGVVAVGVTVAHLGHHARACGHHGDRHETAGLVPHLRHTELGAQQAGDRADAAHSCWGSHLQFLRA
jgi:hypothetical protein